MEKNVSFKKIVFPLSYSKRNERYYVAFGKNLSYSGGDIRIGRFRIVFQIVVTRRRKLLGFIYINGEEFSQK
jgi:hypothetical protein